MEDKNENVEVSDITALQRILTMGRDWKWFIKYRLFNMTFYKRVWYEQVTTRFFPHNRWATKVVPRTFSDVDYIFAEVLFAGLVFFWEEDNGEESFRFQWECEDEYTSEERRAEYKRVYELVKAAYDWAKIRRTEDEKVKTWQEQESVHALDDKHLETIVKYRRWLWT